ncbi:MAG: hypothetical protein L6Q99_02820 [Planctomycetes bacterium]|nr:hypothetical protein [Planctomycetota bacterium]
MRHLSIDELALCTLICHPPLQAPPQTAQLTECVSVTPFGRAGDGISFAVSCSDDGRTIAFASSATDLVEDDTNGALDVFVRDRARSSTLRVTLAADGGEANGDSTAPALSADGRVIAFSSRASNLITGDTNGAIDVFVRVLDSAGPHAGPHAEALGSGRTLRASVGLDGAESNGASHTGGLSGDGRWLVFTSEASNLVVGDTNAAWDVFVRDLGANVTTRIGASAGGPTRVPLISADARFVAYQGPTPGGEAGRGAQAYLVELASRRSEVLSTAPNGALGDDDSWPTSISADGRFVAFTSFARNLIAGDDDAASDVFVRDMATGRTEWASLALGAPEASDAALSSDGRTLVFVTRGSEPNTVGIERLDRATGATAPLLPPRANADFANVRLFASGRGLVFTSSAADFFGGDANATADVFVRELPEPAPAAQDGPRGS